jgi:hypothetical protein
MNPYSPPKADVGEQKPKISVGRKLSGGLCVSFGGLMLIGGIPQLISAVRMAVNPNTLSQQSAGSPGGYLLGTLFGLGLAVLLIKFGIGRFRPRANKTMQPTR